MKSRFRIKCGISQSIVRHHRFPTPSGHRTPIRYPTVIFSTHSSAPRRIDARTSSPNFRSGQSSDITESSFAANIRTTSAYSRTPHGAGHRNKPRNRGCTPVPHTRFRRERRPVRLFSQKTGPNPPPPPRTDCGRVRTVLHARSLQRTHGTAPPAAAAANRQFPARIRETNSSNTPYLIL